MKLTVYNLEQEPLFTGTKEDCKHFAKCHKLIRGQYTISSSKTNKLTDQIYTTQPEVIVQKKTLIDRIFNK